MLKEQTSIMYEHSFFIVFYTKATFLITIIHSNIANLQEVFIYAITISLPRYSAI